MIARIQKSIEEKEEGFTLIELLVVMIIIGILAAIAIPVFLNQQKKANDTATKSDVSSLAKEVAAYYVDGTGSLTVAADGKLSAAGTVINPDMKISDGTVFATTPAITSAQAWCVEASNSKGTTGTVFSYDAVDGLQKGAC